MIVGLTTAGVVVLGFVAVLAYRQVVLLGRALSRGAQRLARAGAEVEREAGLLARSGAGLAFTGAPPYVQGTNRPA